MKTFEFFVDVVPQGKGRPRFRRIGTHVQTYTPAKTVQYEKEIQAAFIEQGGRKFDDVPLKVKVMAFMPIPKSTRKADKQLMAIGFIRPVKKPDPDNILKSVLDALNGLAYSDDKSVVEVECIKSYSEKAALLIRISEIAE